MNRASAADTAMTICSFVWPPLAVFVLLAAHLVAGPQLHAQNENDIGPAAEQADRDGDQPKQESVRLPNQLADGRSLHAIAVFQSQLIDLVPKNYRPIAIDVLATAIDQSLRQSGGVGRSRLKSSFYDIRLEDNQLISERDRSSIVIESEQPGIYRKSLGPVKLAIKPKVGVLPRLEFADGGNLIAVLPPEASRGGLSQIDFSWSLKGEPKGAYQEFTLQIPRTPETRIVLSTPVDVEVRAMDGVLRSRASIPPGAERRSTPVRWYEIEAGGLSQVVIRTFKPDQVRDSDTLLVRRSTLQYEIDDYGVRWRQAFTIQTRGGRTLPPLSISGGEITAVEVDRVSTSFETIPRGGGRSQVQIQTTLGASPAASRTTRVTVVGDFPRQAVGDWLPLPRAQWDHSDVIYCQAVDQTQVRVQAPLTMVAWDLPDGWVQTPSEGNLLRAQGPPSSGETESKTPWSRMRLTDRAAVSRSRTLLMMNLEGKSEATRINVKATIDCRVDPERITPIKLRIQPRWDQLTFSLPFSRRIIDSSRLRRGVRSGQGQLLTIWPEAEDISGGQLRIEVSGQRALPSVEGQKTVPPTWLVRMEDVRSECTAVVIPPSDLNWSGQAMMQPFQIAREQLSARELEFFGNLPNEAMIFRPELAVTPPLALERPDISFDVRTSLAMELEGQEIVETLSIEAKQASQRINNKLKVLAFPRKKLPEYRWSLRSDDDQVPINLPASVVRPDPNQEGVYLIDLGQRNLRGKRLVGRRQYAGPTKAAPAQLLTVLDATSQNAEILLGSGLALQSRSRSVELVPPDQTSQAADSDIGHTPRITRLRYNPSNQPRVEIKLDEDDTSVGVVWQQDISMNASSRGSDSIRAHFRVSSERPIEIDYEPDLQLRALSLNGKDIDLSVVPQRPIRLTPARGVNTIRLLFNRDYLPSSWIRRCKIPRIEVAGLHVKSSYRLTASYDSFAPALLLKANPNSQLQSRAIAVRPGLETTLVHRNLAMATGWLLSALFFSACWLVARRAPMVVAIFLVIASTSVVLWWPWRLAIIGWVIIPAIAAMLLVSARRWKGVVASWSQIEAAAVTEAADSGSGDFSYSSPSKLVVVLAVGSLWMGDTVLGQAAQGSAADRPVNVLVPIDGDGNRFGDKVYIPQTLFENLFAPPDQVELGQVTIQNAVYRVNLDTDPDTRIEVQAEYLLHVEGTKQILLPTFDTADVKRVELRQGNEDRIIHFPRDRRDVLLTLPAGDTFDLRLTLTPRKTDSERGQRLQLAIPRIASSRLMVDATREIQNVRIGKHAGTLDSSQAPRRWSADLGPVGEIDISYSVASLAAVNEAKPMTRQYWVSVGKQRTSVECKVDSPVEVFPGETLQLEILHKALPKVISPSWQLTRESMLGPSQRLITVTKIAESDEPIRLLWSLDSIVNDSTLTVDRSPMPIPEVVRPGSAPMSDPLFAIDHDGDLQVTPLEAAGIGDVEANDFLEMWNGDGQRGSIEKCFVANGDFPSLLLLHGKAAVPTVSQRHQLHVTADQLELRYVASISAAEMNVQNLSLAIPTSANLQSVSVGGRPVETTLLKNKKLREIALGEFNGSAATLIEAVAWLPAKRNRQVSAPVFRLVPAMPSTDTYRITRAAGMDVQIVGRNENANNAVIDDVPARRKTPAFDRDLLALGRIPVQTWQSDSQSGLSFDGEIRLKPISRRRPVKYGQLIAMSYSLGRWSMETKLKFQQPVPDYFDIQIPSRWCDSLAVDGATAWTQKPGIDPSWKFLRIAPDADTVSIRGKLDTSDQAGISVPQVSLLGHRPREVFASVPQRASGQWTTRGVQPTELPSAYAIEDDGQRQNYRIQYQLNRSTWSIELQPVPDVLTVSLAADAQVFLQESGALVLYRWDLIPGNLNSIVLQLPSGAQFRGAWTAQRPVKPEYFREGRAAGSAAASPQRDAKPTGPTLLRLPLSLSRLSQSVELLLSIPMRGRLDDYLPELYGPRESVTNLAQLAESNIPSKQQWVAVYTASENAPAPSEIARRLQSPPYMNINMTMDDARAIALAGAVIEAIDQSLETMAERPKGEVATWLLPWIARYQEVAESAGRRFDWKAELEIADNQDDPPDADSAPAIETIVAVSSTDDAWSQLNQRMAIFIGRFMPEEFTVTDPLFDIERFEGYTLTQVSRVTTAAPAKPIQSMSAGMQNLREFLANGLTLIMVCGLVALLWPIRRYAEAVLVHPAVWLGLIGLFGIYVAPMPVAIAVIVLALTLPLMTLSESENSAARNSS